MQSFAVLDLSIEGEYLAVVEIVLGLGSTCVTVRQHGNVIPVLGRRSTRGVDADRRDHAEKHDVFDTAAIEQVSKTGAAECIEAGLAGDG